jgi:hypothetical protein
MSLIELSMASPYPSGNMSYHLRPTTDNRQLPSLAAWSVIFPSLLKIPQIPPSSSCSLAFRHRICSDAAFGTVFWIVLIRP